MLGQGKLPNRMSVCLNIPNWNKYFFGSIQNLYTITNTHTDVKIDNSPRARTIKPYRRNFWSRAIYCYWYMQRDQTKSCQHGIQVYIILLKYTFHVKKDLVEGYKIRMWSILIDNSILIIANTFII